MAKILKGSLRRLRNRAIWFANNRALKIGKMEEDIALERHFKPIIDSDWNRLSKTPFLQGSCYDWNILFGRRGNSKENEQALYDNPTGFYAYEISVESIENHTINFERSVWNNTTARFIIWSRFFRRRNFRSCRWIACNIHLTSASNTRGARKVAYKL